jgi:amino acid adenylation domain-containing protein
VIYLLHHLVDLAADRSPEAEAFCDPDQRVSYGELARRSNQLARLLIEDGLRPGARVGIMMPRCVDSALAVYATLKAGAAYVPIDPLMPTGGLAHLIEDCGIEHLLAHESLAQTLERLATRQTSLRTVIGASAELSGSISVRPWSDLDAYRAGSPPALTTTAADLAYIMYSSGSTGRPKGIMHTHSSGLSYARLSVETYGVTPEDRIGNHSPLHFDMSTFGYFSGPCAAATTLLVPEAYTKMAASLSQLMESQRLTIWYSVPLALIQLLTRGVLESRDLRSLRWVLFGGEPFPRQHQRALASLWPHARFSNVYGPAEVNQCTYYHVPRPGEAGADDDGPIPIGRIWDDTEGLILDESDRIVELGETGETGETGELLVRSATMMRGYWARPDLDAKAFHHRRLDSNLERTYYRTGDLVKLRNDGELMFLGRKDRQVKVRGYRVELDEIELTITSHQEVEEAAVYPVRVAGEVDHLEAAVIVKPGSQVDSDEISRFVADIVSWYAVPKAIRVQDTLPRTTSGKIDRRSLQAAAQGSQ